MARSDSAIAVNPKLLNDKFTTVKLLAENSKTWIKGQPCILTSGTVTPLTGTGSVAVYGVFAEDQTSSTSTTSVWVHKLEAGALLEVYVQTNGTTSTVGVANIGTGYGLEMGAGSGGTLAAVGYLDLGTANGQFFVQRLSVDYEPERNAAADDPGKCIVKYGTAAVS